MDKVRWGILSTANIGMEKVTPAIQAGTNCEVVAIASRNEDASRAAAAQLGIRDAYGSYEALLEADDVDAVYIPLPNDMHAMWTIEAAMAGKHVLCEKPLAMSSAQAAEMVAVCEDEGVKLAEAFMYRHHPTWVDAVARLRSGEIGDLVAVQSWFSYFNDDPSNIRNRMEHGGGAVMDIGCYNINLSRMLFESEPVSVRSSVQRDPEMGVDVLTSAILEFPGGQSSFTCSIRAEGYQRVHIIGDAGRIEIEIPFNIPPDRPTRTFVTRQGGDGTETLTFPERDQYTVQAELFARAILEDTDVAVSPHDAVANMKVIEAVLGG